MKNDIELNCVRIALLNLFESKGFPIERINDFSSDFSIDWSDEFCGSLRKLNEQICIFSKALEKNDKLVQVAALVVARGVALRLLNQFEGIFEDIESVAFSEEYGWPVIPEDYRLPSDYLSVNNKE
ncbi:hypothetical protein [Pseudomonas sp. TCU-HL1]|uniref:hypothetical protein n=1 Tax=Pseudomonas sp. TCU-HL1 TaxID=1856685 RepID=UPI0011AB6D78|nr:hypothetical protein [Pseudomonas sp. TCU-HL1]